MSEIHWSSSIHHEIEKFIQTVKVFQFKLTVLTNYLFRGEWMNLLQVLHSRCFSKLTAEDTSQLNFWTEAWRCRETLSWEATLPFSTFAPFLIWDQCLNNLKELAPQGDKSSRVDPILERIHNPKKEAGWHKTFSNEQWLKNIGSTSFHHKFVSSGSVLFCS